MSGSPDAEAFRWDSVPGEYSRPDQVPDPSPYDRLTLSVRATGPGFAVLAVAGEIDLANAEHLQHQLFELTERGHCRLVLDLAETTFCDAAGLRALLAGLDETRRKDGWVRLACPQSPVLKVLRITRLTDLFPIYATADEATRSELSGSARAARSPEATDPAGDETPDEEVDGGGYPVVDQDP